MNISTQNFGEIEINTDDIINFAEGLPGFPAARDFVILQQEDEEGNSGFISFLQNVKDGDLCFVMVDMASFIPEYRPLVLVELAKEAQEGDSTFDPDSTIIYNIATIYDELTDSTVNLKAPIVINVVQKTGHQFLCGEDFPIRARLFEPDSAPLAGGAIC